MNDLPVRKNFTPMLLERNAFSEQAKVVGTRLAEYTAKMLGKKPEDIVLVNEVSLDGLAYRPVLNSEMLNVLFEDFEPGAIYKCGRLYLRRTIIVLEYNDGVLKAGPALLR